MIVQKKLPIYNVPGVSFINQRVLPFIFFFKKKLAENIFQTCTLKQIDVIAEFIYYSFLINTINIYLSMILIFL